MTNTIKPLEQRKADKIINSIDGCSSLIELETCANMIDNFVEEYRTQKDVKLTKVIQAESYLNGYLESKIKSIKRINTLEIAIESILPIVKFDSEYIHDTLKKLINK